MSGSNLLTRKNSYLFVLFKNHNLLFSFAGNVVACGGLDNKVAVYPLSMDEDVATKKRTVSCYSTFWAWQ